jgi:hypothetical protein
MMLGAGDKPDAVFTINLRDDHPWLNASGSSVGPLPHLGLSEQVPGLG